MLKPQARGAVFRPVGWAALFLLFAVSNGRGQQTVISQILNNVTGPVVTAPFQNVGQGAHQVSLFITNTSGSCSGSGQLEYSFDNSRWTVFPAELATAPFTVGNVGTQAFTLIANGVFPRVRFNLTAFSGGMCTASAWYSGGPGGSEGVKTVGQATVFLKPFSGYLGPASTVTLGNNGQFYHQMWASLGLPAGAPVGTCLTEADGWNLILSGSFPGPAGDQQHPSDPPHPIITLPITSAGVPHGPVFGSGAFPNLSITAIPVGAGATACSLSVWYAGGTSGNLPAVNSTSAPVGGGILGTQSAPINQCIVTGNVQITAGISMPIVNIPLLGGFATKICMLVLTAIPASADVNLRTGSPGTSCTMNTQAIGNFHLVAGVPLVIGSGLGSWLTVPQSLDLCILSTGALQGMVVYDYQ